MTEKKKFKKRVRARMAETGEPYTQALSSLDSPTENSRDAVRQLLKARTVQQLADSASQLYKKRFGEVPGESLFVSNIVETLMPKFRVPQTEDLQAEVFDLIKRHEKAINSTTTCLVKRFENKAKPDGWLGDLPKEKWLMQLESSGLDELDEEFIEPSDPDQSSPLPLVWRQDPDMSRVFNIPPPKGCTSEPYVKPPSPFLEREINNLTLKLLEDEVQRLRDKLQQMGIDPDEEFKFESVQACRKDSDALKGTTEGSIHGLDE